MANIINHKILKKKLEKIHISKRVLEHLYIKRKLSTRKIAKKFNCSKNSINNRLRNYNIKIRNHSEAGKARDDFKEKYVISPEKLRELYYNKKLSMQQIADLYGINHSSIIYAKFKKLKLSPEV